MTTAEVEADAGAVEDDAAAPEPVEASGPVKRAPLGALPNANEVRTLVDGLLDRGAGAEQQPDPVLRGRDVAVVGCYVDGDREVRAVVMLDLTCAASVGGALALVPPRKVAESVEAAVLSDDLGANAKEVLNVAASWFSVGGVHLKLADVAVAPAPVAEHVVDFLRVPGRRKDFAITVPGYGDGVLAIIAR